MFLNNKKFICKKRKQLCTVYCMPELDTKCLFYADKIEAHGLLLETGLLFFESALGWASIRDWASIGGWASIGVFTVYRYIIGY